MQQRSSLFNRNNREACICLCWASVTPVAIHLKCISFQPSLHYFSVGQSQLQIWGGATCCPVNLKLTAATKAIIHLGFSTLVTGSRAGSLVAAVLCAFCLILLSFPPFSGRCSLLPSVMRILSKMLFNFRKGCWRSLWAEQQWKTHNSHLFNWCTSPSDNQMKTSF